MDELEELAVTAKADTAAKVIQKRESYDNATCIGAGRLKEVAAFCRENDVSLLIFDNELTATQIRNIENLTEIRTIDRTTLILDIFAQRARSKEGRLQVELAQQKYPPAPSLPDLALHYPVLEAGLAQEGRVKPGWKLTAAISDVVFGLLRLNWRQWKSNGTFAEKDEKRTISYQLRSSAIPMRGNPRCSTL